MLTVLKPGTTTNYGTWNEKTYNSSKSDVKIYWDGKELHVTNEELETMKASARENIKTGILAIETEVTITTTSTNTVSSETKPTKTAMRPCPKCGTYCYGDCTAN